MRRMLPRIFVPLLLIAGMALGIMPAASAHGLASQGSLTRVRAHVNSLLRRADIPLAARFGFPGDPTLSGRFRVPGSPYRWQLDLSRNKEEFFLTLLGIKREASGVQGHYWGFLLPGGDASMGPGLHVGHIHTGARLGPLGKIDLSFSSARPLHRRTTRCFGPPPTTYRERRLGTLKGSLDFTPDEGTLPALHVSHMRAIFGRGLNSEVVCTHAHAASHGRSLHVPPCFSSREISVDDKTQGDVLQSFNGQFLDVGAVQGTSTSFEDHFAEVVPGHLHPIHITQTGMSIDGSSFAPLLSGSLLFEGTPTTHHSRSCQVLRAREVWSSGTLIAHLDSGAVALTGSHLMGRVVITKRA